MKSERHHSGATPHSWLQHHVPWLGLFALVMGLFGEEADAGFQPDEMAG